MEAVALAASLALLGAAVLQTLWAPQPVMAEATVPPRPTCVAVVGDQAVTSDDFFQVLLWDLNNPAMPSSDFDIHAKKASYVFATAGKVFSASYDGWVHVSPIQQGHPASDKFREHRSGSNKSEVWAVAVSSDGTRAVSSTNDGQILVWKTNSPYSHASVETDLSTLINSNEEIGGLAFIPNNRNQFISGHADGKMFLWDVSNSLTNPDKKPFPAAGDPADNQPINSVAVTRNGKKAAAGSFNHGVVFWDVQSQTKSAVQPDSAHGHTEWVWRVAFSPNDAMLASASEDGKVKVWKVADGSFIKEFDAGSNGSMGVAWWGNQKVVFTGDGTTPAVQIGNVP